MYHEVELMTWIPLTIYLSIISIGYRSKQGVLNTGSSIWTEMMNVILCWPANIFGSIYMRQQMNVSYEFIPDSPTACFVRSTCFVMGGKWSYSCSFEGMILDGFVQNSMQHLCDVSILLFLQAFCQSLNCATIQ